MGDLPSEVVAVLKRRTCLAPVTGENYMCPHARCILTALTAAGYAVVKVAGEPAPTGALTHVGWLGYAKAAESALVKVFRPVGSEWTVVDAIPVYAIEPAPKEATDGE